MNAAAETRHNKQRNVKTLEIHGTGCCCCCRWISHLHLTLRQMGPELLGGTGDLPLVSQQVHPEILDIIHGEPADSV